MVSITELTKKTPLMIQYEKETGRKAIYGHYTSTQFHKWVKINIIKPFVLDYIKEHTYFSAHNITIDYIIKKCYKRNIKILKYDSNYLEVIRVIDRILRELKKKGRIKKFNSHTYKINENYEGN